MASSKALLVFCIIYVTLINVDALNYCNKSIIDHIESNKHNCQPDLLTKLSCLGTFTFLVNPEGAIPKAVKCVNGRNYPPSNGKAVAVATLHWKNQTMPPTEMKFTQKEVGCAHIKERDEYGIEYHIWMLNVDCDVFCYYRCTDHGIDGVDFGACDVPVDKQNDFRVKRAVKKCIRLLKDVGLTTKLVYYDTCKTA